MNVHKTTIVLILTAMVCFALHIFFSANRTVPSLFGTSVVSLTVFGADGKPQPLCSAVVVRRTPVILITSTHCFKKETRPLRVDGLRFRIVRQSSDLTLIEPEGWREQWAPIPLASDPTIGDDLAVVGYRYNIPLMLHGIVAGYDAEFLYIDAEMLTGMSGGAVVNDRGELLTVVWKVDTDGPNTVGLSALTATVRSFLTSQP